MGQVTASPQDCTPFGVMEPLRLSFLAAVKRIDRLRGEVFSREGQKLIEQADTHIDSIAHAFERSGDASTGEVITLIKFAGYMNDYVRDPDIVHLKLADQELNQQESLAA